MPRPRLQAAEMHAARSGRAWLRCSSRHPHNHANAMAVIIRIIIFSIFQRYSRCKKGMMNWLNMFRPLGVTSLWRMLGAARVGQRQGRAGVWTPEKSDQNIIIYAYGSFLLK